MREVSEAKVDVPIMKLTHFEARQCISSGAFAGDAHEVLRLRKTIRVRKTEEERATPPVSKTSRQEPYSLKAAWTLGCC